MLPFVSFLALEEENKAPWCWMVIHSWGKRKLLPDLPTLLSISGSHPCCWHREREAVNDSVRQAPPRGGRTRFCFCSAAAPCHPKAIASWGLRSPSFFVKLGRWTSPAVRSLPAWVSVRLPGNRGLYTILSALITWLPLAITATFRLWCQIFSSTTCQLCSPRDPRELPRAMSLICTSRICWSRRDLAEVSFFH